MSYSIFSFSEFRFSRLCSHQDFFSRFGHSTMQTISNDKHAVENTNDYHYTENRCRYGRQCFAFQRLDPNGYRLDDVAHCSKYFHPERRSGTTVPENLGWNNFITTYQNWGVNLPKGTGLWNGRVRNRELLQELENNGFSHVMNIATGPYHSLYDVAREKLKHLRHLSMESPLFHDQMLAIILYTDTNVRICRFASS